MERLESIARGMGVHKAKKPIKVTVTGAAGNIGYALIFMIGQGRLFGPNQPVDLTLLETVYAQNQMKASAMELHDCVFPLLNSLKSSLTYEDGFKGCELAILVGAKPRGPGMERKDLLGENAMIFREQGKAIDAFASKNCKVLVVGNPANTNCLIVSKFAPSIPKENFSALTRLDENRAVFQLAEKTGVKPYCVYDMIIWGNHSSTQVPDYHNVKIEKNGELVPLETLVTDKAWLQKTFIEKVQKRGAEVISLRKLSSAASAANAICDHIYTWFSDTTRVHSMAVISNGQYGIEKGLCFSFPVLCKNGTYKVIEGWKWTPECKKRIDATIAELKEEKEMAIKAVS